MKRNESIAGSRASTAWIPFVTKVLAFIGLWQVLTNSTTWITHWF
ncbi:MAG TPA: hypothetical protein V6C84_16875 [Coleofasciculaceae cyanobacterium]